MLAFAVCWCLLGGLQAGDLEAEGRENAAPPRSIFDEALAAAGLEVSELGFRPKSYWARFPHPAAIPYKPRLFDDLFAEPTRIYDAVRIMALAAEDYLDPRYREAHTNSLYQVVYFTGIEKKYGGFRAYSSALAAKPTEDEPLLNAFRALWVQAGRVFEYRVLDTPADWPLLEKDLARAIEPLVPAVERAIARAVLSLAEAHRWIMLARRNVDLEDLLAVWRIRDLSETQFDAMDYYPEVDDVAAVLDEASLYYGAMKVIEASEILLRELQVALRDLAPEEANRQTLDVATPFGHVIVAGTGNDEHRSRDALLVVDLGGDDLYEGPAGATPSADRPVAVCIDLSGDDRYVNEEREVPAQGAALFGAAVLIDAFGNDQYQSRYLSQGAGQFGVGLLADLVGDDRYQMEVAGQGAGLFGVGLLLDLEGTDAYRLAGDGQGYGGVGGVGTLVDVAGNDFYYAEPKASVFYRPDYHGWGEYNYSYAQGAGIGRRGDISDGHSWAGGIGTLIDLAGDDHYVSGTWSLGSAYWFGVGFCYDKAGNDIYESCTFAQASGAHFCIAALIDEAGDDRHVMYEKSSDGCGFGHDYTVALFLDRSGNDEYDAWADSLGFAIRMSQAFFLDLGGDDIYRCQSGTHAFGMTDAASRPNRPALDFTYEVYSLQVGLFIDAAGNDRYLEWEGEGSERKERANARLANSMRLVEPMPARPRGANRHFGIAIDTEASDLPPIPWLEDRFSSIHAPK
ncbi:MAG: hypothetical protein AB1486_25925 [Planctomycetota bacterium]